MNLRQEFGAPILLALTMIATPITVGQYEPFGWFDLARGAVLGTVVAAYLWTTGGSLLQRLAFAGAFSFATLPAAGFVMEFALSGSDLPDGEIRPSEVTERRLAFAWLWVSAATFALREAWLRVNAPEAGDR